MAVPLSTLSPTSSAGCATVLNELDHPQAWRLFSRREGDAQAPDAQIDGASHGDTHGDTQSLWESHVVVSGMTCAACSLAVEQAVLAVPGVREATVNAASGMARVRWSSAKTRPSEWLAAIRTAGYDAVPVDDARLQVQRAQAARRLLWRWLVAGFCMMQVMMYAVPAYIADPVDIGADARQLMRWASWVLTVPVLVFSAVPFFAGAWRSLRQGQVGMDVSVAFGLLIAFVASSIATFEPGSALGAEVWFDSVTMFVFFLLSARLLEQSLRERSMSAFDSLGRSLPSVAYRRVTTDGPDAEAAQWEPVALEQLRVGDVVRVRAAEVFPADGLLCVGQTRVDESLLTGESQSLARGPGDRVIAGSHNLQATVHLQVQRVGQQTRHAGMVALMQQAAVDKPAVAQLADRLAAPLLLCVLLCSGVAAAWWWPADPSRAIGIAVAVLIVTCPCALSLATPSALVGAAGALARRGVLLRRLQSLSALARADRIVFDKTGTLTVSGMALRHMATRPGMPQRDALTLAATLAEHSLHPLSRALVTADTRSIGSAKPVVYAVTETVGQGVQGWRSSTTADRPDTPLRLGSARFCGIGDRPGSPSESLTVHLSDDRGWVASFVFEETLRDGVDAAVRRLRDLGIEAELLSGDRAPAVLALSRRLGIDHARGDMTPADKLAHVRQLQDRGHTVVMVGDGLNDAPVLARADASIALGDAAPLARAQADVLIPGGEMDRLPQLVIHARRTQAVIRQNLAWAVAYNAAAIPLAMAGWMPPWLAGLGMAMSSLWVVLNAARLGRVA